MRVSTRLASVAAVGAALSLPLAAPAAADASYGAIAINHDYGHYGVSYGYPTLNGARQRALAECPGYCRIKVWFEDECGAVIQTSDDYVAGLGSTPGRAIRHARDRAGDPSRYRVVVAECS